MNEREDALLSVAHAAKRLDRHRETVYRLIRAGHLKAVLHLGDYRIKESELARYIAALDDGSGKRTARVGG